LNIIPTNLDGVLIIEPGSFGDQRGYFMEIYQKQRYQAAGVGVEFVQDNISFSRQNTLRGLHFQHPRGQAKLVQVLTGEIYDVAVDIRRGSPTFGQWTGVVLSENNHRQLFVPQGFAHGFCVLSETAHFQYKCSDYYSPRDEGGILWNDPVIGIEWPIEQPLLSDRDRHFPVLRDIPVDRLPSI
jgi:dTDP-4-dehydrorhamnose 3,5-epimerase